MDTKNEDFLFFPSDIDKYLNVETNILGSTVR